MTISQPLRITAVLATLFLTTPAHASLFPKDEFIKGWEAGETRVFSDEKELSTYIDGGAVLYMDYYFEGLAVQEYSSSQGGHLTVEIYKFSYPEDAWGICNQDTTGTVIEIGQGGRTTPFAAHFWKDDLYVRAFVWETNMLTEGVALLAAKEVDKQIKDKGKLLGWLDKLEKSGQQIYFVRNISSLKRIAGGVLPDSIEIPEKTGAAWVRSQSSDLANCLVINCADTTSANNFFTDLCQIIKSSSTGVALSQRLGFGRRADGKVQAVEKLDCFVLWVPAGKDEKVSSEILNYLKSLIGDEENKP